MKEMNIVEFAKESKYMTQMESNTGVVDTMTDLKTVSEMVGNIINNKDVTNFVYGIPVGYSISNPVKNFYRNCACGNYDKLTNEQYNEKLDEIDALGIILGADKDSDTITLDVRDTYKHLVDSVTEVQKSVKQIYDVAMLVQMIYLSNSQKSENE